MKYKLTRKQAMDAFCTECIYDSEGEGNGTKQQQIEDCTSPNCPLFEYRIVTKTTRDKRKKAAYEALSDEEKAKYDARAEVSRVRILENPL